MGRAIPIFAILQWVGGILLAHFLLRRARRYGGQGAPPRVLAGVAIAAYLLAVIIYITISATGAWRPGALGANDDSGVGTPHVMAFLQLSLAGWVACLAALAWSGVVGVAHRRRVAAAELGRMKARVMAHRTDRRGR